ncbi:MAG: polyprenol monophosphomannose synthase [Acidimicrobiia bacterium]|nr:MAG: polyprenol monophosphomannose synthase [Acidimicrobiia bacterium]
MSVLVIVPTYNEAENILAIVEAVRRYGYDILIVDDGSPDGTGAIADELAAADSRVHVLHRAEKAGLGPAYTAGFERGLEMGAEILCEMDADFSHDPADLGRLVEAIEAGADLAIGSRYVPGGRTIGWPWYREALSRGGNAYAALMLGVNVRDATAGFRAFRDTTIRKIDPSTCKSSGYGFQVEMAWRTEEAGLSIVEVPITFKDREYGESKMSSRIAIEAMALVTKWGLQRLWSKLRRAR